MFWRLKSGKLTSACILRINGLLLIKGRIYGKINSDKTDSIFLEKEIGKESKFQGAVFEAIKYTIQGPDQCAYPREVATPWRLLHRGGVAGRQIFNGATVSLCRSAGIARISRR